MSRLAAKLALRMLSFGVTVLPDPPWHRLVELMQFAEQNGFDYGWTYDSHVLRQEPYPLLTLAARGTERRRDLRALLHPRPVRGPHREVAPPRGRGRRPVEHLLDGLRPGRDARGVRQERDPGLLWLMLSLLSG